MKTTTITCDHCGEDLTTTSNCVNYRIVLSCEQIPSAGGMVTLMHVERPLNRRLDFCGERCFAQWSRKEYPDGTWK